MNLHQFLKFSAKTLAAMLLTLSSVQALADNQGESQSNQVMVACACAFVDSFPDRSIALVVYGRDRETGKIVWSQGLYSFTCGGPFGMDCDVATRSCQNYARREPQCRG